MLSSGMRMSAMGLVRSELMEPIKKGRRGRCVAIAAGSQQALEIAPAPVGIASTMAWLAEYAHQWSRGSVTISKMTWRFLSARSSIVPLNCICAWAALQTLSLAHIMTIKLPWRSDFP